MRPFKSLAMFAVPALLVSALPSLACPIGLAVDIEWNGGQFDGVVLEGPDPQGNCYVSYDGWDETWNEWVAPVRLKPLAAPAPVAAACPVGASRQVEWNGTLWAATILDGPNGAGECFITYDEWASNWDEWVGPDRIAPVTPVAGAPVACPVGIPLEIQWNGTWWDGTVLEGPNAQGQCFVTYSGWDASWNEWVTADRMRDAP